MERGSSLLISFLLANFACIIAAAGGSCDFSASQGCFPTQFSLKKTPSVEVAFSFLKSDDLNNACNRINTIKNCVKNATKNCDSDDENPLKKRWTKVVDTANHVCDNKRQAFIANKECLSKEQLVSAAVNCQRTHQTHSIHQRYARDVCNEYQQTVECINKEINDQCGAEIRNLMDRVIRNFLSLADIEHDCDQTSSGRSTKDSIIVSFIMSTAAFLLALLLNK